VRTLPGTLAYRISGLFLGQLQRCRRQCGLGEAPPRDACLLGANALHASGIDPPR